MRWLQVGSQFTLGLFAIMRTSILVLLITIVAPSQVRQQDQIARLLADMTLEEKVGQMTQLTLGAVSRTVGNATTQHALDPEKLRHAIVDRKVGSILNVADIAFDLAHWQHIHGAIRANTAKTRLKVPVVYGIDAVHGANYTRGSTLFPHNLGMAATWSEELVRAAAAVTAQDVRASGIPWNFAPVVDVARTPLWSRFYETYGEDVHLASRMGAAAVRGMQGADPSDPLRVGACLKHFVGYGFPLSGKDRTAAWIPERMMRELFLPPFTAGIEAGAVSVMVNSGEVNGVPVHSSHRLLSKVLRQELGFKGVVLTDWEDVKKLRDMHRVAPTYAEAARMAVRAGVDLCMVPLDYSFTDAVIKLVRSGELDESRIDRSVLRILWMKQQLGLFDPAPAAPAATLSGPEAHALSLRAARESLVLLKNDGTLPLGGGRVLLAGPGAVSLPMLHGSWTWTWQGTDAAAYPEGVPTVLEALRGGLGQDRVTYVPGWAVDSEGDMEALRSVAADVLVAVIGEEPSVEKPGDIEDLTLSSPQVALVRALIGTGKPVVLVLLQGRPRLLEDIADGVAAIVHAGFPGPYGAQAITDVLTGSFNPCGRLPFTYPRKSGSLVPYDHKESARFDKAFGKAAFNPQFPFGHGLSYARFTYEDLKIEGAPLTEAGEIVVSVTVKNEGARAGRHVALLFVRDEYATITPPVQRLRGFQSVTLEPGAGQRISWTLEPSDLAFVDRSLAWKAEVGSFSVRIGKLTQAFELR